ncbi:2-isopropylmalate synthase [Cokeromyces recurvatus]|uniref:2-isopropylmalate synthase n=1 Tax=Cokeromyces recurvatus TaxID=90255 RepID=UPI00221EBF06|nr:2-isopropylmalate synthase [Cokeromyces recurvatus]KAI7906028.1 2-isopropylmalate synthase [Cokeromyces recurvatus]
MTASTDKLVIFDTTLRDGEQSPGVTLNAEEKIEIAKQLSRLGVDVLEAGFPIASLGDFEAVNRIAREVGPLMIGREKIGHPMTICGLARSTPDDIKRCAEAIAPAPRKRIHVFLATSDLHLKYKLKINREECIQRAVAAVTLARTFVDDVEFSPEDAGRSDPDFLCQVLGNVIEAGATTLNIPDTVGYNMPEEYGNLIKYLIENTPGSERVIFSTHCHNDLGLATANTLAGISHGARQVEVTINGIGERAGNTSMEEIVMAIHTHPNYFPVHHTINTTLIYRTSQMVSTLSGMMVQANKAIVGRNAFLHESGIHQDGVLKNRQTYEIITPETVGVTNINLVLGKHSGRNAFRERCKELGFIDMTEADFQKGFENFKTLCDKKKNINDADILAILSNQIGASSNNPYYTLVSTQVVAGANTTSMASVKLYNVKEDKESSDAAVGVNGPIDAIFEAIQRIIGRRFLLTKFDISAVGEGNDALGKAEIQVKADSSLHHHQQDNRLSKAAFTSSVADVDIITAATKAYLSAINKQIAWENELAKGTARSINEERKVDI